MERAGHAALRSADGEVRELPLLEPYGERAPDPRPARRGVDAGIGGRQAGGVPLQIKTALQPLRPVSAWPQRRAPPVPVGPAKSVQGAREGPPAQEIVGVRLV